jgi:hypothetical protein
MNKIMMKKKKKKNTGANLLQIKGPNENYEIYIYKKKLIEDLIRTHISCAF